MKCNRKVGVVAQVDGAVRTGARCGGRGGGGVQVCGRGSGRQGEVAGMSLGLAGTVL